MLQLARSLRPCSFREFVLNRRLPPGFFLLLLVDFISVPVKTSFYMTSNLPLRGHPTPLPFNMASSVEYRQNQLTTRLGGSPRSTRRLKELTSMSFLQRLPTDTASGSSLSGRSPRSGMRPRPYQMAFLNGDLEETTYLSPTEGSNIPAG
jgi:hypothetical protein